MTTVTERREREAYQRREAARCAAEGHGTGYWHFGDYSVPDRLICPRCGETLAERPHGGVRDG